MNIFPKPRAVESHEQLSEYVDKHHGRIKGTLPVDFHQVGPDGSLSDWGTDVYGVFSIAVIDDIKHDIQQGDIIFTPNEGEELPPSPEKVLVDHFALGSMVSVLSRQDLFPRR